MPLEATQHTPDGAKAFAQFFVKTIDWGIAVTSGKYIRHYATPTCAGCLGFAEQFDQARAKKHHFAGGRITEKSASAKSDRTSPVVAVVVDIQSYEELDQANAFVSADEAHNGLGMTLRLSWQGTQWAVTSLTVQP